MSDPIDRQMAIDEIEYELEMINSALDSLTLDFNARERLRQRRGEAQEILNSIQQLPSVQLEQKRGKWINDKGLYKCSCCNQLWAEWWAASKPIERMNKEMPYCPMCGSYNGEETSE